MPPLTFKLPVLEAPPGIPRRGFIQLLGGALATAGFSGCFEQPSEVVVPYVRNPPDVVPGIPLHYATANVLNGFALGLVVESWQGHPTKVEGNPAHPASLGATRAFEQALPRDLYDPGRAVVLERDQRPATWNDYQRAQVQRAQQLEARHGEGLHFLLEPTSSPLLGALRARIARRFPQARFHAYDALSRDNVYAGAELAFGAPREVLVDFSKLRTVLALDADFLGAGPTMVSDARAFAGTRMPEEMSRLYVVENALTVTGMFADHRLRARTGEIAAIACELLRAISIPVPALAELARAAPSLPLSEGQRRRIQIAARDLASSHEKAAVLVGPRQPAAIHALAHAINAALGSLQSAMVVIEPALLDLRTGPEHLRGLIARMRAGEVDTLVISAFDPYHALPADLGFREALARVPNSVYWGLRRDSTTDHTTWFVPAALLLESWADARAPDGSASIVQPLIRPIFDGKTEAQLLGPFAGAPDLSPHVALQQLWRERHPEPEFGLRWTDWLAEGVIPSTASPALDAHLDGARVASALASLRAPSAEGMEIAFAPDHRIHDGRYAKNPWLQELPDPVTKITWSNAALLSRATAARLDLHEEQMVRLEYRGRAIELPAYILAGHADDSVTVHLGWGRAGPLGQVFGASAEALRDSSAPWFDGGLRVTPLARNAELAITQRYSDMHMRPIAIQATKAELEAQGPRFLADNRGAVEKLYDPFQENYDRAEYAWAMAIDLARCTGCASCVIACQSENNVPWVGPGGVRWNREMHWLRIDRYFLGHDEDLQAITQPLACVQCENAPCEYVCPVNATVHSDEGLNEMVYNRCVGTRFCSNNCPYKVRRFNFFDYPREEPELVDLARNPQVTVRDKGVMEKCTYCVQRIEAARIAARIANKKIDTDALKTACAQACPTEAIVFGSLHAPDTRVAQLHRDRRRYQLLHELGTEPRTVHLARIKNPNPELT